MNNARRKALNDIMVSLKTLQQSLSSIRMEEEMSLDSLPESLRYSDKGQKMEDAISHLESAYDHISEASEDIVDAQA